ncbi:MAG: tetratricopeptide repeat protein [Phycisphaerae bacterium]|nr:tetratricopeptide repeat protein [Phycisphaerae bacterium]
MAGDGPGVGRAEERTTTRELLDHGRQHHAAGRLDAARRAYHKILDADPEHPDALHLAGLVAQQQGDAARAIELIERAIARQPSAAPFHVSLGQAQEAAGQVVEARASYARALELDPQSFAACNSLGLLQKRQAQLDAAADCFEQALRIKPDCIEALVNLGTIREVQGRFDEAQRIYEQAGLQNPDHPVIHNNLGKVLKEQGRFDQAMASYDRAINLDPEYASAHRNRSHLLLLRGDLEAGWSEYEWRLRAPKLRHLAERFAIPRWNGKIEPGTTLLIYAEQGIGDEIMFLGLVPTLVEAGVGCVIECDGRLLPLLRRSMPQVAAFAKSDPPANLPNDLRIDFACPIGSLGRWLHPALGSSGPTSPYLLADVDLIAELRGRYQGDGGQPVVGISWRGGRHPGVRRARSIELEQWARILEVPGLRLVSLQYGEVEAELARCGDRLDVNVQHDATIDPLSTLDRFAAQVAACDLVISVDNATVHMAGALGRPTWVLLPAVPDWRWMLGREDSPWYPSMRLFRQRQVGGWDHVLSDVARAMVDQFDQSTGQP